jgi:trk system potassium uptake protein TrkA
VPARFLGIPLGESKLRQQHGVTIAAFRDSKGVWQNADNATVLAAGDAVLIVGPTAKAEAFAQLR